MRTASTALVAGLLLTGSDYYAKGRRNDVGRHATISPDETVTVKLASYNKVVNFQTSARVDPRLRDGRTRRSR